MALNVAKVTLCFQQGIYGWTESYFLNNPSDTLTAELTKANALANKRLPMSGADTSVRFIKVSNEQQNRDVLIDNTVYGGATGKPSDAPDTAILTRRLSTDPASYSPLYLRGVWDELIKNGGQIDPSNADWNAAYSGWRGLLNDTTAGWGFIARDLSAVQISLIGNVVQNANGTVRVTTEDPIFGGGSSVGERFKGFVSGVTGAASVNGSNVYIVRGANFADTEKRIPIFPYVSGGKFTFNTLKFFKISGTQLLRVIERKVGRPSYASRGRRPARKLA